MQPKAKIMARTWHNAAQLTALRYTCGYCNVLVGPDRGFASQQQGRNQTYIYICSHCSQPTFLDEAGRQFPGVKFGNNVTHLPQQVMQLYDEARGAMSSQAYTPAVLSLPKDSDERSGFAGSKGWRIFRKLCAISRGQGIQSRRTESTG